MTLGPGTAQAIVSFLADKGLDKLVRIDLGFTGCCDSSLSLKACAAHEGDLAVETEGITFFISPDTYQLSGDITITYSSGPGREGFVITSSKQVSEWDGFGVCNIKI